MSGNLVFETFRTEEDWGDWEKYVQIADAMPGLTEEDKRRAKRAFEYLRKPEVLGETFLARNKHHPLYEYFAGTAPWTRRIKRITRLAEAWGALRESGGFSESVKDVILKDKSKFDERMSVLELAFKFLNVGFRPTFDKGATTLKPRGFTGRLIPFHTKPDLALVNDETNEEIFVEVSALSFGELKERASLCHRRIFDLLTRGALWKGDLYPRARINKILNDQELEEATAGVRALVEEARGSNEFRKLEIESLIEACVAPRREAERVDTWAADRGIKDAPVEGPSFSPYDPVRLKNIIRKEQEQLPHDRPGIIVITADWSLLFFAHGYGEIISSLDDALGRYPKLLSIIVSHIYGGGEEEELAVTDGRHTVIKKNTKEELTEETVIAVNGSCNFSTSSSTTQRMQAAFVAG